MRTFLCDVDGVVADFTGHVLSILGLQHIDRSKVPFRFDEVLNKEEKARFEELLSGPEFWLTLPVVPEAQNGVEKIRTRDIYVHWVSSPHEDAPLWHWARVEWLKKHFGSGIEDLTPSKKKWMVDGDFMAEDTPDNVIEWVRKRGGRGFLFDQPYNRDEKRLVGHGIQRVSSWEDLPALIP